MSATLSWTSWCINGPDLGFQVGDIVTEVTGAADAGDGVAQLGGAHQNVCDALALHAPHTLHQQEGQQSGYEPKRQNAVLLCESSTLSTCSASMHRSSGAGQGCPGWITRAVPATAGRELIGRDARLKDAGLDQLEG